MKEADLIEEVDLESFRTPSFCKTMRALLNKNFLIMWANRWRYLLIFFSPLIVLLLILLLQNWTLSNLIWQRLDTPIMQIPPIPQCFGQQCVTIAYAIDGSQDPYINHTMEYIKNKNNLTDKDIEKWDLTLGQTFERLELRPNKTQAVVVFCTDGYWDINGTLIPCAAEEMHMNSYTIIFNLTLNHRAALLSNYKGAAPKDMVTVRLKRDVDEGIINYYGKQNGAELDLTVTEFPSKNSRFLSGISIFAQYGSFFITIPYLILMVMQGSNRLKQKQDRLRIGLNIVGVSHFQFYLSQILTYFLSVLIISINFCIFGYLLDLSIWSRGIIWFDFLILLFNGFTLGLVSFCVVAMVGNKNLGMSILYGFILYSIVMQWLFSGGYIVEFLYMDTASPIVKTIKFIFDLYPSFHFSKVFSDMVSIADSHFNTLENRFIEGRDLLFEDLFNQRTQTYEKPFPHSYTIPSAFESSIYMCLNALLYLFILIILDRYIESNRGYTQPLCGGLSKKRKKSAYFMETSLKQPMVQISNLQKIYSKEVHALRGVSLTLNRGQIVSLLGQNGAGKSTLINILIGALSLTRGQVIIDGKDISQQMTEVRKVIGVCPQFDILWEQMTAQQHIRMFSKLKGINQIQIEEVVKESLSSVKLYEYRSGRVSTFSGGMRRRLSLAISLIGNPKLVILDEPTTGMDAKIRQQTWKIILGLRDKRRTMLITTHNMEESECLSDRIIIMNKGRLIIDGTTVELKNKYGTGYLITGYKPGSEQIVSFKCKQDQLEFSMQRIKKQQLQRWELKETSLEEVFLNVVNKF